MAKQLSLLLASVIMISCQQQSANTKTEGENLMQVSRDWSTAASKGNIDSTLSYWADDAIVMSPGQQPLKGKAAIRGMLEAAAKIPGFKISWEPKSVSVSTDGNMAYLIEETEITMNDSLGKPFTQHNKAVTIWKKDAAGNWKNAVDIWNENPVLTPNSQ